MSRIRRFLATAFVFVASLPMGAQTPLNVYVGPTLTETSAIERVAVDGLEAATLMIAGLAQLDEALFGIVFFFESAAEESSATIEAPGRTRDNLTAGVYQEARVPAHLLPCSSRAQASS